VVRATTAASTPATVQIGDIIPRTATSTPGAQPHWYSWAAIVANTATFTPGVPIGGIVRPKQVLVAPGGVAPTDVPPTHAKIGDIVRATLPAPPAPPADAELPPTARLSSFAGRFGALQSLAETLAPCLGIKLSHKTAPDAVAYNNTVQRVNQTARPVSAIDGDTRLPDGHLAFGSDTLGGKFPLSFTGNQFAMVFMDHTEGKRDPVVSVFNSHHSVNSCLALADWISTRFSTKTGRHEATAHPLLRRQRHRAQRRLQSTA
jgi:hypothetical protein